MKTFHFLSLVSFIIGSWRNRDVLGTHKISACSVIEQNTNPSAIGPINTAGSLPPVCLQVKRFSKYTLRGEQIGGGKVTDTIEAVKKGRGL